MEIYIPDHITKIIEKLNLAGYQAYLVGGCVRDSLLGKQPYDFDISTDATPDIHKKLFAPLKVVETGIKHGTVTVITEGGAAEITTFRTDGEYKDNRHPEGVKFTNSVEEDLSRRDFTVNALAYHPKSGLLDLFGGTDDLKKGIIRTVGEPAQRFSEDALRILRALRFSSVLGFEIEKETALKIKEKKNLLENISRERILLEMKKLICGKNAYEVVLDFSDVINTAFKTSGLKFERKLSDLPFSCDVRFAALLCECEGEAAGKIMRGLKCEKTLSGSVAKLISDIDFSYDEIYGLKKFISERGYEHAEKLAFLKGDERLLRDVHSISEKNPCLFIKDLAVSGTDLNKKGIEGENTGKILKKLLELVMKEKLENIKEELLTAAEALQMN